MIPTEDQCWEIVQRRDGSYDGVFFVGVLTTKIYCRPSCSARPLRKNVRFFADSAAARAVGLRACLRCHPDDVAPDAALVAKVVEILSDSTGPLTLAAIAAQVHFSPFYVNRVFQRRLGVSVRAYAASLRQRRLAEGIGTTNRVADAVFDAGYGSLRAAYAAQPAGVSLRVRKAGGAHTAITWGNITTPLGQLAVAQTNRGVCFVALADDEGAVQAAIESAFPLAVLTHDQTATAGALAAVSALAANHPLSGEIALDIQATAFQQRVWDALRAIPVGETRTYSDIAVAIGQPTAVRAVAQACAHNPVAVIVPCHRVVHRDAQCDGYRWGVARKQALLTREQQRSSEVAE
jgi:AraC family transcriptional regulator, regulatory protein of adaptative response / methylated-DNA-[protein]-cysteine methyltransferase